jgi:hypothetical protein
MANITMGLGFYRTFEHELAYRKAAHNLPDDWNVLMVGDPASGVFTVTVKRPDESDASKTFPADGADDVVPFLEALRRLNA